MHKFCIYILSLHYIRVLELPRRRRCFLIFNNLIRLIVLICLRALQAASELRVAQRIRTAYDQFYYYNIINNYFIFITARRAQLSVNARIL